MNLNIKHLSILKRMAWLCALCVFLSLSTQSASAKDTAGKKLKPQISEVQAQITTFVQDAFSADIPQKSTLWLDKPIRKNVKKILRHKYGLLRVKYWQDGARTVWILEEIGKYKPITVGVVIDQGRIEKLSVLAYRESHGWEVKHDFFTRQFIGAELTEKMKLDENIDGISGATLSVRALKKVARLALYLDGVVQKDA